MAKKESNKIVDMKIENKETQVEEKQTKLSYNEVVNIANQLTQKCNELYKRVQEQDLENTFTRLHYLFKVVKFQNSFPNDFVEDNIIEIIRIMAIKKEDNSEQSQN